MYELACDVVIHRGRGIRGRGDELIVNDGSLKISGALEFALRVPVCYDSMSRRHGCGGYQSVHKALCGWSSSTPGVMTRLLRRYALGQARLAVTS